MATRPKAGLYQNAQSASYLLPTLIFEHLFNGKVKDCGRPAAPRNNNFYYIACTLKMDPTPSFGVSMISEVTSNPQLTLVSKF